MTSIFLNKIYGEKKISEIVSLIMSYGSRDNTEIICNITNEMYLWWEKISGTVSLIISYVSRDIREIIYNIQGNL